MVSINKTTPAYVKLNTNQAGGEVIVIGARLPEGAPAVFEVRGEVFMENEAFAKLNEERDEAGEAAFINPRNATAGTLKQLDPKLVEARPLDCIFHSYGKVDGAPYATISEFQKTLED